MSATNELARRDALQPGMLVYYDTISSGRVPCRIIERKPCHFSSDGELLTLKVTARRQRGVYPPGLVFTARVGPFVQAR